MLCTDEVDGGVTRHVHAAGGITKVQKRDAALLAPRSPVTPAPPASRPRDALVTGLRQFLLDYSPQNRNKIQSFLFCLHYVFLHVLLDDLSA